jgi:mannonate dehydratase
MKRRDLFDMGAAAAMAAASALPAGAQKKTKKPVLMKIGTQHSSTNEVLRVMAAFGINNICSTLPSRKVDESWSVENLTKLRERIESFGIKLDMVPLPLSSAYITRHEMPDIMTGKSPERDRQIDQIIECLRNCQRAGIPSVKYNMSILGVVRIPPTPGRGGAMYSTWNYDKAKQDPPLTEAGPVPADVYWERINYFLDRVAPVANELKVKIACHPHDPGMPKGKGYRGVETVLGNVEGLKKFVSIKENPYHGLNFCQGTVTEMLENPAKEIFDVIRYFGGRKKIFNVHFRNIEGKFGNFRETLPDNGDINMIECARVYKEVGYDGMLMPDHVPHITGDPGGHQAFAYCFGYIQAVLQLMRMEA